MRFSFFFNRKYTLVIWAILVMSSCSSKNDPPPTGTVTAKEDSEGKPSNNETQSQETGHEVQGNSHQSSLSTVDLLPPKFPVPSLGTTVAVSADPKELKAYQQAVELVEDEIQRSNKKSSSKVRGLHNCGNTCFMNSVLQCLFHTQSLNKYFNRPPEDLNLPPFDSKSDEMIFLRTFHQLAWEYYNHEGNEAISPRALSNLRDRFMPHLSGVGQNDASAYYAAIMSTLQNDLNRIVNRPPKRSLTDHESQDYSVKRAHHYSSFGFSIIDYLFDGVTKIRKTCKVGRTTPNMTETYEWYKFLPLRIYKNVNELEKLIDLSRAPEKIDPKEKMRCGDNQIAKKGDTRQEELYKLPGSDSNHLPGYLVLNPQRLQFDLSTMNLYKINQQINIPKQLNLVAAKNSKKKTYDLYCSIIHSGGTKGGHYVAHLKDSKGQWHFVSDSNARPITEKEAINSNKNDHYILFYQLKNKAD